MDIKELAKKLKCSVTTIRNRIKDTDGIKELFYRQNFITYNNVTRTTYCIKDENIGKYKELIKKKKRKKAKSEFKISETVLECYNAKFKCKNCINQKYCPPHKPLQLLVLDLMDKGFLEKWK